MANLSIGNSLSDLYETLQKEYANVKAGKAEQTMQGVRNPNTNLQKFLSDRVRDVARITTNPNKPDGNIVVSAIKTMIKEAGLKKTAEELQDLGVRINPDKVKDISDILTRENIVQLGEQITLPTDKKEENLELGILAGDKQNKLGNLREYLDEKGKLPSYLEVARSSYMPKSIKDGKAIYDPITPENQNKFFDQKEIDTLASMLREKDTPNFMDKREGILDTKDAEYPNALKEAEQNAELDKIDNPNLGGGLYNYLSGVSKDGRNVGDPVTGLGDTLGSATYGSYDPQTGEWNPGVPDKDGDYTVRDTYNWNRDQRSGIAAIVDAFKNPTTVASDYGAEGVLQTTGPDKTEGIDIEINVPTYTQEQAQQVMTDRFGAGYGLGYYMPNQEEIYTAMEQDSGSSEDNEVDDSDDNYGGFGDFGDDFGSYGMKGGGYIFREVNKLKMNNRNAKNNLYEMIGIKPVVAKQYGGGLSDAYSTLADRRQNMYGMGQTPSQMSSVFQDPMEASAFSPVNMEHGGDIVVPKERMINDQPHELSYINPQEAKLLKDLGGSGRRVDGIPAYFSGEEGTDMDDDSSSNSSNDSGNDTGPDVTAADAAQQAKDDAMYSQYAGGYSNQMSVDPDDPSGYLDSYGDEFGRNPDGTTKTRSQAIAENYQYGINNLLTKGYSEEKAKRFMDRSLGAPGGYDALSRSYDLSRSPELDIYDNYLSFAKNQLSPVMNLAKEKQEIANYYRDLKEDEETEQYKEPGFFDKAGNFFGNIVDTYKGKNQGLGQFLGDDTRTGAFGNRPSGISGGGITTINEDPEDTENLQTVGENLGLEFSPTTAGERQAVGIASLIDPTGVLSVGQLAKGLLSGLTGDETVGTARDPITGELFSFSSKGNLAPISPEDDPGFANRDDEGNPAKILKKPIPLKPPVITEKEVEEKEEVTTDGKLSNRAKASAESIKSLIKLRNASSDAQIDAIISDLGIDKAGLTVSEFLKELGIER